MEALFQAGRFSSSAQQAIPLLRCEANRASVQVGASRMSDTLAQVTAARFKTELVFVAR